MILNGTIEKEGMRVGDKLYPWNSLYNINDTMLFDNHWHRMRLEKVIGMNASFRLVGDEIWSPTIWNEDGTKWKESGYLKGE